MITLALSSPSKHRYQHSCPRSFHYHHHHHQHASTTVHHRHPSHYPPHRVRQHPHAYYRHHQQHQFHHHHHTVVDVVALVKLLRSITCITNYWSSARAGGERRGVKGGRLLGAMHPIVGQHVLHDRKPFWGFWPGRDHAQLGGTPRLSASSPGSRQHQGEVKEVPSPYSRDCSRAFWRSPEAHGNEKPSWPQWGPGHSLFQKKNNLWTMSFKSTSTTSIGKRAERRKQNKKHNLQTTATSCYLKPYHQTLKFLTPKAPNPTTKDRRP